MMFNIIHLCIVDAYYFKSSTKSFSSISGISSALIQKIKRILVEKLYKFKVLASISLLRKPLLRS